ncbi:MAG: bifunctional UDP-sugar hydrolase/5'-nucleotidase [Thermodesulfobacteriota bacterium]
MKSIRLLFMIAVLVQSSSLPAAQTNLTLVHTNDLHSHFLGFAPMIDYVPDKVGADNTRGGWARVASAIKQAKADRSHPVLVVDAGDFSMGSLFHLLIREEAFELRLMKTMGYDVLTLGNHEFDLKPRGLTRILNTARKHQALPPIVQSNTIFSQEKKDDDDLEKLYADGTVKPYVVLKAGGLKVGFFGLMGVGAAENAPFASPVKFDHPFPAARRMVEVLRNQEKVDVVVCLSHSGLNPDKSKSEDEQLAKQVQGLDVIISGHTHTRGVAPILVGRTIIIPAWCYGQQVGILDLACRDGQVNLVKWEGVEIDGRIKGDEAVTRQIQDFEKLIEEKVLSQVGLKFNQAVAETDFDLRVVEDESNLGNLIGDAIRWSVNQRAYDPRDPRSKVAVAVCSNGLLRDDILRGRTGRIAVGDAFAAVPLGIGSDDTMAYPLVTFYLSGSEIKKALEILTTIYPLRGGDFFLQISGLKFVYNPKRLPFDRVTDIYLGDEEDGFRPLDYSSANQSLYRVTANIYNATYLKIIGNFTYGLLEIKPKDRQGRPISDLKLARVDADNVREGVQELKEWVALIEYLRLGPDNDRDGLNEVPDKYRGRLDRMREEPSYNPVMLLRRGTFVTWLAAGVLLVLAGAAVLAVGLMVRRAYR